VAEKILSTLSQPFAIEGKTIFVTTSVGISLYPNQGNDAETLIKAADNAMYHAKELGKNRYKFAAS
jgi:diguanylate cyclase (GGDEF)-like protein